MKNPRAARKLILAFIPILLLLSVTAIWLLSGLNRTPGPEDYAKDMLSDIYTATQNDYGKLTGAIDQGHYSDQSFLDYVHTTYPDQFTDNGCNTFILNHVLMRAAVFAHNTSSDINVTSVTLTPTGALEGSKQFYYKVLIQSAKDASVTKTYKGLLRLIQEDGNWKVDGIN